MSAFQNTRVCYTVVLQRNGTTWSDGDLRMHTGQGDMERLGQIVSWNQNNQTEAFQGKIFFTRIGREKSSMNQFQVNGDVRPIGNLCFSVQLESRYSIQTTWTMHTIVQNRNFLQLFKSGCFTTLAMVLVKSSHLQSSEMQYLSPI